MKSTSPLSAALRLLCVLALFSELCVAASAVEVYGHRGARAIWPENSLPGFQYAADNGIPFHEMDVHLSRDNQLVVIHNAEVSDRCVHPRGDSVERRVFQLSVAELHQFDCGVRRDKHGRPANLREGTRIPTLEVVLEAVLGIDPDAQFDIEIKYRNWKPSLYPSREVVVARMVALLEELEVEEQVVIQSFDREVLRLLHERRVSQAHSYRLSFLYGGHKFLGMFRYPNWWSATGFVEEVHAEVFSPNYRLFEGEWLDWFARQFLDEDRRYQLVPYTVNNRRRWKPLIQDYGVDGLIVDDPVALQKFLLE